MIGLNAFSPQEAARVDAQVDWVVIPLFVVLLGAVFAFDFALLAGGAGLLKSSATSWV